jgi:hypothetical protein
MRKWIAAHRRVVLSVVIPAVWVAGIALLVSWGRPLDQAVSSGVMWAVYAAVLWFFQGRRERKTADRLDSEGAMLVYVRYPDSRPGSLSGIWDMGVASFDGKGMKFQPAVYENLEPSGRPITFRALTPRNTEPRKIERKEQKYLTRQGFQAIRLTTDKGDIEVAGRPDSLRKILGAIGQEERS